MENFWTFLRSLNSKWGSEFRGRHDKLFAYSFLLILIFFSILDRAIDWDNYSNLCNSEYQYSLATGHIQQSAKDGLLSFAIIGLFCCALETLNALTLLCCQGHVLVPIEIEQGVILLLEQIPQAIINLAVTICRNNFVTSLQAWQCFWGLVNTSLRLYAYGYAKERIFPLERSGLAQTRRIATYITTTFLWLFLVFNNIFLWRHAHLGHRQFHRISSAYDQLDGVSIALERTATHTGHEMNATTAYQILQKFQQSTDLPYLIENIADIARASNKSTTALYTCRKPFAVFEPEPCASNDVKSLKFVFKHVMDVHNLDMLPAGALHYNYALVQNRGTNAAEVQCLVQNSDDSLHDWRLVFYRFELMQVPYINQKLLQAHRAWEHVCVIPKLKYDARIKVCD